LKSFSSFSRRAASHGSFKDEDPSPRHLARDDRVDDESTAKFAPTRPSADDDLGDLGDCCRLAIDAARVASRIERRAHARVQVRDRAGTDAAADSAGASLPKMQKDR